MTTSINTTQWILSRIKTLSSEQKEIELNPELLKEILTEEIWEVIVSYHSLNSKQRMYVQDILKNLKKHSL